MKVLHENSYKYLGTSGKWHVFESTRESFDPELLYLYRARFIKNDGSSQFFDPIKNEIPKFNLVYEVTGFTSDHQQYCIPVEIYNRG